MMDTSETYTEMCEKATEIQAMRPVGQYYCYGDYVFRGEKSRKPFIYIVQYYNSIPCGTKGYTTEIWLPRQDQLQEMIKDFTWNLKHLPEMGDYTEFYTLVYADGIEYLPYQTAEEALLPGVMRFKYNKGWNGDSWKECKE